MFSNMKALCCASILFFGGSVMAAQPQANAAQAQPQGKASAVTAAEKVLGGPIGAINPEKKEISILRNSVQYPVLIGGSTQIVSGNQPIDFSALSVGDKVVVTYTRTGDARTALTVQRNSLGPTAAPAGSTGKSKPSVKAEPKKAEASAAAPAAPKAEMKAEPKKAEASAAAPAAPKAEVKVEPKKAEASAAAPAAPKAEVKAEPKKAEASATAPAAPKAEVKAEPKKAEALATPVAPKAEVKAELKKAEALNAAAAPKVSAPATAAKTEAKPVAPAVPAPKAEVKK
jgi:hypothetical protein